MTRVDLPAPLMHHDPDRSWITDPDPDHPKGTQPRELGKSDCHTNFVVITIIISVFTVLSQ